MVSRLIRSLYGVLEGIGDGGGELSCVVFFGARALEFGRSQKASAVGCCPLFTVAPVRAVV